MVAGVLVGLLALAEPLPRAAGARALRLASWALILTGVTQLAGAGGEGSSGGGGGWPAARWLEERLRGSRRLPPGPKLWALAALRPLSGPGSGKHGRAGGGGDALLPVTAAGTNPHEV